jgi:hypothetical protein
VDYRATEADRARLSAQISTAVPYTLNPASFSPATNLLFHNNGNGTFSDVSELSKVTNPTGRSLGALWHDFDDDGWLDLYVANDISDNVLFHNSHGQFEDVSHAAYVADYRSAMGLAAGDYDRDGDDDLFIGHWLGQENALYENLFVDNRKTASPAVAGATNSNPAAKRPPLCFMDSADRLGLGQIALPYVSWGTDFCDFDGDGWLDLVVANGSSLEEDGPFPRKLKPQESFLFWNDHGRYFHNLAPLDRALATPHVGRGLALCDYDNDGAMDVLISYLGEGVQLLRNQMQTGHWLKIQFRSRLANGTPRGFGDGAKVIAHVNGVALRRTVSSVSYLSQSSRVVHFGLGEADHIDRLEVRWLGGATNTFEGLSANTFYEVTEGEASPRQVVPQRRTASANGALIPAVGASVPSGADKNKEVEFWRRARAAMDALKVTKDIPRAIEMFRGALELNPNTRTPIIISDNVWRGRGTLPERSRNLKN